MTHHNEPLWQYRRVRPDSDETEGKIFPSRGLIPAGEGWQDSRGEALAGKAISQPAHPVPNAFQSVADQVAELERQHAADAAKAAKQEAPQASQAPAKAKPGRKPGKPKG
jgi:hypothetical protein